MNPTVILWKSRENRSLTENKYSERVEVGVVDPRKSVKIRGEDALKNKCGPDQPSEPHRSWISLLAFPPLGAAGRRYWSDSAHAECHFYQYWLQTRDSVNHFPATPAVASCPAHSRAGCGGGRNARATGTHSRAFPNFPWQFTLENCQSATGVTAIISWQALRFATYSVNPLWYGMFRAATEKHFPLVQKLWTTILPCGKLRKTKNETPRAAWSSTQIQQRNDVKNLPLPARAAEPLLESIPAFVPAGREFIPAARFFDNSQTISNRHSATLRR